MAGCMLVKRYRPNYRYRQHERNSPLRTKEDTTKFKPFFEHFEMAIKYSTPKKYLADRMVKKNIRQYQSEVGRCYNIMRERPTSDPLYSTIRREESYKKWFVLFIVILCCFYRMWCSTWQWSRPPVTQITLILLYRAPICKWFVVFLKSLDKNWISYT